MSTSERPEYNLKIQDNDPALLISVISNDDRICASNVDGPINVKLPRGLYTIRTERDGRFADTVVRLVRDDPEVKLKLPERFTATLLPDAETTHEYYTYDAWRVSQDHTVAPIPWNGATDSRLMLFLRSPSDKQIKTKDPAAYLRLITTDGKLVSDFPEHEVEHGESGWTAWSAETSPGLLILHDDGAAPRQLPIRLLPGFQTQIYVMHRRRLLLEDMRVLTIPFEDLDSRSNRDPYEIDDEFSRSNNSVDAGLAALQNGVMEIGDKLVAKFLRSKFKNPLLGLIGAYLMILRKRHMTLIERHEQDGINGPDLMRTVISNLARLLPDAADVTALKILAEPYIGEQKLAPVWDVPIFGVGTEVIIKRAAEDDQLVPDGSMIDRISDRLISDSVWTAWAPMSLPPTISVADEPAVEMSWVELAIADAIDDASAYLDRSMLAQKIGVTKRAVEDHFTNLVRRASEEPDKITQAGHDISRIRRGLFSRAGQDLKAPLLTQLAELNDQAPVSYQLVYPRLKEAITEVRGSLGEIHADDPVEEIVSESSKRKHLFDKLADSLMLDLKDISEVAKNASTVRDIASLVVRKMSD